MRSIANRRLFLTWLFLSGCGARRAFRNDNLQSSQREQLTIGTLSYGMVAQTETKGNANDRYDSIKKYLEEQLRSQVQIEPAFNENKALERIAAQAWSLVFAPPGLAAIAISQYQYTALLPLEGVNNVRSILVVKQDSNYQDLRSLTGKKLAIGLPGSATGYYFPLYNFYGLTLSELIVSSTPKAILEAVAQGSADVGALSLHEFNIYKSEIKQAQLRILFVDPHRVPTGAILVSSAVDLKLQESIHQVLKNAPSIVAQSAGFIPNGEVPDYQYTISVIDRVRSIFPADQAQTAALLRQKPVRLFKDKDNDKNKK